MKKIIIITSIFLMMVTGAVAATTNKQITDLYKTDENLCKNLVVKVSGINISSKNYYIMDCGEGTKANTWYCNCETDDDFEISFVNSKYDYNSYIIDIISGSFSVRRIVSKNILSFEDSPSYTPSEIKSYDSAISNMDRKIETVSKKVDSYQLTINKFSSTEKKINDIETKTNALETNAKSISDLKPIEYDDTQVYNSIDSISQRLSNLEGKEDKVGFSKISGFFLTLGFLSFVLWIYPKTRPPKKNEP